LIEEIMRGDDLQQMGVFSYVSAEERIAADHPLRAIRRMADEALASLSGHFDTLYAVGGRPSIAPEKLMRALLLQALYSVRSERQLMEQLDYNLLFRWFVGLNMDDAIWDVTVFTKNRERLLRGEVAERLLLAVVEQAHAKRLLSEEHFTIDGTLIQAWVPTDRSWSVGWRPGPAGAASRRSPIRRIRARERGAASCCATRTSRAPMRRRGCTRRAVPPRRCRAIWATCWPRTATVWWFRRWPRSPAHAPNPKWPSALTEAERTDPGFAISQRKRKLVEKVFGWAKLDRALRQVKLRGLKRVDWMVQLVATAHNLRRMQTLLAAR
jgi:transposase